MVPRIPTRFLSGLLCRYAASYPDWNSARGLALTDKTGAFLRFGVIASLLLTAGGADAQTHLEQARLAADQQPAEQNEPAGQAATAERYRACLENADASHDASRAAECKRIGEKDSQDYANCVSPSKLNLPKSYCDASYPLHDVSPNCTLPTSIASVLDGDLQQARYRCLQEKAAASQ